MPESQPGPKRRALVFEPSFEAARTSVEANCKRFDELTRGAQWRIEENAESCPVLVKAEGGDPEIRFSRAQEQAGAEVIRLWFTISSDTECRLWHVDAVRDPVAETQDD